MALVRLGKVARVEEEKVAAGRVEAVKAEGAWAVALQEQAPSAGVRQAA